MRESTSRAGLSVLVALTVLVLLVEGVTGAAWSDGATIPGTGFASGRLDLTVDGADAVSGYAGLGVGDLLPGGTTAAVLTVANRGTVPLTWRATAAGTDPDGRGLAGALLAKVTGDAATTTAGSGRTCAGSRLAGTAAGLGGALVDTPRPLAPGGQETVCVELTLPVDATAGLQGSDTAVTLTVIGTAADAWADAAPVTGTAISTLDTVAPVLSCGPTLLGSVTLTWSAVPGATGYRLHSGPLGALVTDLPATTHSTTFVGVAGVLTVETLYGPWASQGSESRAYSALTGVLGTCT